MIGTRERLYNIWSRNIFPASMENCVLYLPLWQEDMQSSPLLSYDPNHHSCTVIGALWKPYGRNFDGTNDFIAVNSVANGGFFGGAFTMIGWGRLADWAAGRTIMAGGRTAAANYAQIGYRQGTYKYLRAETYIVGATNKVDTAGIYENDSDWHFFAMTVDADGHINHFVVDGTDIGSDSTNDINLSALDKFYVGQIPYISPNASPWKGDIGESWVCRGEKTVFEIENIRLVTKWRYP